MKRHLNITVRWMCLFSDLYSSVLNINQHLFFFVLNPGLMFINISTKLFMARTDGLYIYLMTKENMTVHQIRQHDEKDVALIFKVKTGPHM